MIVGQMFLYWGQSAFNLMWIGIAIALLGILFLSPIDPAMGEHRLESEDHDPASIFSSRGRRLMGLMAAATVAIAGLPLAA